jgi:two-component system OmpR family response regulator
LDNFRKELKEKLSDKKVLIVDDDESILEAMSTILSRYANSLDTTSNPVEVVDSYKSGDFVNKYDIVISDITMPSKNGIEMIKEIFEFDKSMIVIFISGHSEHSFKDEATKLSKNYLEKPITLRDLATVLLD